MTSGSRRWEAPAIVFIALVTSALTLLRNGQNLGQLSLTKEPFFGQAAVQSLALSYVVTESSTSKSNQAPMLGNASTGNKTMVVDARVQRNTPSSSSPQPPPRLNEVIHNNTNHTFSVPPSAKQASVVVQRHYDNSTATTRPPLESILKKWDIIGDPQFLLHFAVIGHAKCGTSTLMQWLGQHEEVQMFQYEVQHFMNRKPASMLKKIYMELEADDQDHSYKYGYKNPGDVEYKHILEYFQNWFPKTGLFVGLRHPVLWFQSFYNFRIQNWDSMPNATRLIGRCTKERKMTCTHRARFHYNLYGMHKTNTSEDRLTREMKPFIRNTKLLKETLENPVFLFDTAQLADKNETRTNRFRKDVQEFLGLSTIMPPMSHVSPGKAIKASKQEEKDSKKINICDDQFIALRKDLMIHSRSASKWIRKQFLKSPTVVVSSPDYFNEILLEWMEDPCRK